MKYLFSERRKDFRVYVRSPIQNGVSGHVQYVCVNVLCVSQRQVKGLTQLTHLADCFNKTGTRTTRVNFGSAANPIVTRLAPKLLGISLQVYFICTVTSMLQKIKQRNNLLLSSCSYHARVAETKLLRLHSQSCNGYTNVTPAIFLCCTSS